jgi:prepilin-type N-terminal cleavage/methylation domain-containing protein
MRANNTAGQGAMAQVTKNTNCSGFTLVEMMVVIVVIGVLALMAVPNFQDTIVRNEIKEALPLADIAKQPVALAWAVAQALPRDNAEALLPVAEKIVSNQISSVAIKDGAINITFGNRCNGVIKGKVLTLRPAPADHGIVFRRIDVDPPVELPASFVSGLIAVTTLLPWYQVAP